MILYVVAAETTSSSVVGVTIGRGTGGLETGVVFLRPAIASGDGGIISGVTGDEAFSLSFVGVEAFS